MSDNDKQPNRAWRQSAMDLCVILLPAVVLRAFILFTAQGYLRSDESVVGMMAHNIWTRHELPLFLYGQAYGGGHALVAYIAAPLFAIFGMSGALLTGITVIFGLANVVLVWLICRRHAGRQIALFAGLLYALAPAVVYGHFLVNGGTEATFFALLATLFFMDAVKANDAKSLRPALAGLFSGLAVWCMDFSVVYPLAFVAVWLTTTRKDTRRQFAPFGVGCIVGALPLILYDLSHEYAHIRAMLPSGGGGGGIPHVAKAFGLIWIEGLPTAFQTKLDNFEGAIPLGAWVQYAACVAALGLGIYAFFARRKSLRGRELLRFVLVFAVVFCVLYCASGFSSDTKRTPRYFIPLFPAIPILMAFALNRLRRNRFGAAIATTALVLLAALGVIADTRMANTDTFTEHRVTTSGRAIRELVGFLEARDIRYAFAPYEIKWRLMFESGARIVVSSEELSVVNRYPRYNDEVTREAVHGDADYVFIFRKDFAFVQRATPLTRALWLGILAQGGARYKTHEIGNEFTVFYDLPHDFVKNMNSTQ